MNTPNPLSTEELASLEDLMNSKDKSKARMAFYISEVLPTVRLLEQQESEKENSTTADYAIALSQCLGFIIGETALRFGKGPANSIKAIELLLEQVGQSARLILATAILEGLGKGGPNEKNHR